MLATILRLLEQPVRFTFVDDQFGHVFAFTDDLTVMLRHLALDRRRVSTTSPTRDSSDLVRLSPHAVAASNRSRSIACMPIGDRGPGPAPAGHRRPTPCSTT